MNAIINRGWRILLQTVPGASRSVFSFFGILLLSSSSLHAIIDFNNNGVSDLWERRYNSGNLYTTFDPTADPDGDGWTNAQESVTGTDPAVGNPPDGFLQPVIEHFAAVYITPEEEGGEPEILSPETTTITWSTLAGKHYTLFASTDLAPESWRPVGDAFIGTGSDVTYGFPFLDPEDVPDKLFWRVSTEDVDTDGDTLTNAEEYQMGTSAFLRDSDADGLDDNVDPQPTVGSPSFADADGDGIPDEYDGQPDVSAGVAPTISSETATVSRIVNVADGDSLVFLVSVQNPSGPPVTAANLKLFVSGTADSANFTPAGGNRFSVTWAARVHDDYPATMLQNLSVRFEDSRKATAWLELARLDIAEWQGMLAGLAVHYHNVNTRTFSIGGHSAGVQLLPASWSGAYGTGSCWYRGPRNVMFYGGNFDEAAPGVDLGTLSISAGMRYPLFIIDDTGTPATPEITVHDISNPVQFPHGFWGLNQWSGQIKMEGTGATIFIPPVTADFFPLPQPDGETIAYTYEAKFLKNGEWKGMLDNIWPIHARTSGRMINALTTAESSTSGRPTALEWGIRVPIEARIVASAAGSLEYPGLPLDNPQDQMFLAPNQWHRIVVKVGPDAAVVARGVRLRVNSGASGTDAAQAGFEFKRKTATGFESFTPGEILEDSALYTELTSQSGLVLFAKLSPAIDRLHRLSLDLLPNSDTLEPLEIRKLELVPVKIDDNNPATGVDNVSITADSSDIGYQSKFWIMAPCGNDLAGNRCSNDTTIKIPMEPENKLRMDCSLARCEYRYPVGSNAASPAVPIGHGLTSPVRWLGTGAESGDHTPIYQLAWNLEQVELPIRVKTMKRRTVKVKCYMVRTPGSTNAITTCGEASLTAKLNAVFGSQINVWFEVEVKQPNTVHEVDFDLNGDGHLLAGNPDDQTTSPEEAKIVAEVTKDPDGDIHIYYVNRWLGISTTPPATYDQLDEATGYLAATPVGANNIFVSLRTTDYTETNIINVVAHEIGHIMFGPGHPNDEGGLAPLLGTDRSKRLMSYPVHNKTPAQMLAVKTEWDKADTWLSNRTNTDR